MIVVMSVPYKKYVSSPHKINDIYDLVSSFFVYNDILVKNVEKYCYVDDLVTFDDKVL